jgi:hypothetical protein
MRIGPDDNALVSIVKRGGDVPVSPLLRAGFRMLSSISSKNATKLNARTSNTSGRSRPPFLER